MGRAARGVARALCALLAVVAASARAQTPSATPVPRLEPLLASGVAKLPPPVTGPASLSARAPEASEAIRRLDAFARGQRLRAIARAEQRAGASAADARQRRSLRRLRERQAPLGPARVSLRPGTRTPRQIAGIVLERAAGGGGSLAADLETSRRLLRAERALLRLDDPDRELALARVEDDALGHRHLRFAQSYAGLRVWPSELIVHLDPAGDAYLLDGGTVPTPIGVDRAARISARDAVALAIDALGVGADATSETPELIVFAPGDRPPRLAWSFAVDAGPLFRRRVAIDALSGELAFSVSEVMHANVAGSGTDLFAVTRPLEVWNEGGSNYLVDTSKPMYDPTSDPPDPGTTRGAIAVLDAQNQPPTSNPTFIPPLFYISSANPHAWSNPSGVSAAFNLARTFDYYLAHHARSSIDGEGGSVLGVVRLGLGYPNAFWHSGLRAMFFGDGQPFAGAADVVGHELTHGVIDASARLLYLNQSGAANESLADVFGEMVEASIEGSPDWLLGADLSAPVRNMANPSAFAIGCGRPYPDRMSAFLLASDPLCGGLVALDEGGVHLNSGILNRAYYLLAAGLPDALGTVQAEQIFYRALTLHLTSTAQFVDVRLAAVASATELFGAASLQVERTAQAFDEVEIFDGAGSGPPLPLPPQEGDDSTLYVRRDTSPSAFFLMRHEGALADPPAGSNLSFYDVSVSRASVTRDGSTAWFVDSLDDACVIATDADPLANPAEQELCTNVLAGLVASLAISPDGNFLAVVLNASPFDPPTNQLTVFDLRPGGSTVTHVLNAPTRDGSPSSTLLYADAMSFNANGGSIVFDALNELSLPSGVAHTWSIYLLDLTTAGVFDVVAPIAGASFDYPALSRASDEFITFDAVDIDTGSSTIYAGSLYTGDLAVVDTVPGFEGVPFYSGGDEKILFSQPAATPTGTSLHYRALQADHITPTGPRTLWLADADFGVVYNRGEFVGQEPDLDVDGIPDALDNCPLERNSDQDDDGGLLSNAANGIGNACECGDLGVDGEIGDPDIAALRDWLARAPAPTPALQRCSVAGGIECDVRDFAVLTRARNGLAPALAQVCAAASPL
jgi:bacillolysin